MLNKHKYAPQIGSSKQMEAADPEYLDSVNLGSEQSHRNSKMGDGNVPQVIRK